MYCVYCGKETDGDNNFCGHCGMKLSHTVDESKNDNAQKHLRCFFLRKSKSAIFILIAAMLMIAAGAFWYIFVILAK
ncbi:MAG: zinc ribbon domain-containing protein [Defluviitaleaceae bacterium]|nr:zinc ribbon domain-containing protein [Defluviitaleaceae bacterium]